MNQTFKVAGMTCQHCVSAVTKAVLTIDSTAQIQVDLEAGFVAVKSPQPRGALVAAIEEAGYKVGQPT